MARLLSWPNIRLHLTLNDGSLTTSLCNKLEDELNLNHDLTKTRHDIDLKFHRYRWDIKVSDPKKFRLLLKKYQENNPDVDIYSEDITYMYKIMLAIINIAVGATITYALNAILSLL